MRHLPPLAFLGLLSNATVWGLSWIPFKSLQTQGVHPLWATAVIYGVSALAIAITRRAALRDVLAHPALVLIALGSGMTNACFNTAVAVGDVVRVVLLFYLMPLWSVVLAKWVLHEAITYRALGRIAIGLAGAMIVLWQPQIGLPVPSSMADWLAIAGGFFFALNNVMLRKLKDIDESARAIAMFGGGVGLTALAGLLLSSTGLAAWPALHASGVWATLALWSVLFLIGNLGLQYGASRLPANITAVVMLTEILIASLSAWLAGSAQIRAQDLIGGALILAAPWLIQDRPGGASRRASA